MTKLDHCEITVSNLDEAIKFYQKTLGLKLVGKAEQTVTQKGELQNAKMRVAFLDANGSILELIEYLNPKGKQLNVKPWDLGAQHLAFEVKNIHEIYNNLKRKGINFLSPPIDYKSKGTHVI